MSLVSLADVRALAADGGLSDSDLQAVIDREEAELVRRFGAHDGPLTEIVRGHGRSLYLARAIASVTSITEYLYLGDTAPQTLTTSDYYVWGDEGRIERLTGAGYGAVCWGATVTVVYTPVDQADLRSQVLLELVRLATAQDAGGSVSGLGYSIRGAGSTKDWEAARSREYARLGWLSH